MKKTLLAMAIALCGFTGAAQAAPSASGYIINGTTFATSDAFQFSNTSTAGETITKLVWDLTPVGAFFDTTNNAPGVSSSPFSVSGSSSNVGTLGYIGDIAQDGLSILTLTFTAFNPGDTFIFGIDTDLLSAIDATGLIGSQFFGATATAYFSNGDIRTGSYVASTNPAFGSQVGITTPFQDVPEPASLALVGLGLAGLATLRRRSQQV